MLDNYQKHVEERLKLGIPPKPLGESEVTEICDYLKKVKNHGDEKWLVELLKTRVNPGVDAAAKIKAQFLYEVALGKYHISSLSANDAIFILGTMLGGYNVDYLLKLLREPSTAEAAANALKNIILIYDKFTEAVNLSKDNKHAYAVLESWSEAEWFLSKPPLPEIIKGKIYKVDGEINTDDLSPAKEAWSRPDIPLHALSMGQKRFPEGIQIIKKFREEGFRVIFAADVLGTGSSRKSATNSLMWHIGEDIPFVPNKRRGGIVLAGLIAPIFFNTFEDSGGLPIMCDISKLKTGDEIEINTSKGKISKDGVDITSFRLTPETIRDEYRAGGRLLLIIGKHLTKESRNVLNRGSENIFIKIKNPEHRPSQGYTLAQKVVGKACGKRGVLPGESCEPLMTTVGSQDTTGPMTADELKELACMKFQTGLFMQSFCHTAAYPKKSDAIMHKELAKFVIEREGVALKPGDGIIHSWLNRLILPDTVGTGGDSHTRFPMGLSFPAGSGLVAFSATLGFMPLDMPESVLVKFKGTLKDTLTLRDVVNAIPYFAIKEGLLTVEKKNKKNIFNGRILEMEGLEDLTVEQAFELTDASAERSAAGATIKLSEAQIAKFIQSNIALMKKMIEEGYECRKTLENRIRACEEWLKDPILLSRDNNAEYKAELVINLDEIEEPLIACPNDPDDVKKLSEVAGSKIDEVFIGSCMTNIGHFRAAGHIFNEAKQGSSKIWLCPPTKMDEALLKREGFYSIYSKVSARIEIPGCSLCMGNQARVANNATVVSTSTRNFDNRLGDGAKVYLASAELSAIAAICGELPSVEKYFNIMEKCILPKKDEIYKYLEFDKMEDFKLSYA
jgi:aconitate hydratase 2/2-methylisocitrate dehydratase